MGESSCLAERRRHLSSWLKWASVSARRGRKNRRWPPPTDASTWLHGCMLPGGCLKCRWAIMWRWGGGSRMCLFILKQPPQHVFLLISRCSWVNQQNQLSVDGGLHTLSSVQGKRFLPGSAASLHTMSLSHDYAGWYIIQYIQILDNVQHQHFCSSCVIGRCFWELPLCLCLAQCVCRPSTLLLFVLICCSAALALFPAIVSNSAHILFPLCSRCYSLFGFARSKGSEADNGPLTVPQLERRLNRIPTIQLTCSREGRPHWVNM